jgi:insulysin
LLKFHKDWYSANIMKLCISSQHPLDQQEKWAREMFEEIENKNVTLPDYS